jgi:hypothetical protein
VIPAHFEEFKQGIKELIMEQFFNEENIRTFFRDSSESTGSSIEKILESVNLDKAFDALVDVILGSSDLWYTDGHSRCTI